MNEHEQPDIFHIDLTGGNGTPFRFEFTPGEGVHGAVRYRDRRYTLTEGKPGYGINHMNENGQSCGPVLDPSTFTDHGNSGIRGWHSVDAWDIDRKTVVMVGMWLSHIAYSYGLNLS